MLWLLGVTFVEIPALSFAVEITVPHLEDDAGPGTSLERMPIFGWYIRIATALTMLVAFPP